MTPTRRQLLATVSATGALALAGCAGDGGGDATTTTTTTTADGDPVIQVGTHEDHGEILVDGDGRTLYMFDQDEPGAQASTCSGECAAAWPPLTVDSTPETGDAVTAGVSTFERAGGATQVAAGGWPLYYYSPDQEPGDATGQGVGGVWWVLAPDGTPKRETTTTTTSDTATHDVRVGTHEDHGEILVDGDGRTLYMFDQDTQGGDTSSCTDGCADAWPPHTTADTPVAGDAVTAPLATIDRGDGSTQITADGWPLYRYAQDGEPGDATGQGVGGVWWVLAPDGTPTRETSTTTTTTTTDDDGGIY